TGARPQMGPGPGCRHQLDLTAVSDTRRVSDTAVETLVLAASYTPGHLALSPRGDVMSEHHREEIAHDVEELRRDLAFERATLDESISHDYSTADTGIVPLDRRRPMWHFMGLWTTFVAGFSYMFLGFEIHDGGHSLASTIGITLFGYGLYVA